MKTIDIKNWHRKKHFELFTGFDYPHINVCVNMDLSKLLSLIKAQKLSVFKVILYIASRAANEIPEFRQRIREPGEVDGQIVVVEHELVRPSYTVLLENELFSFCTSNYLVDFPAFAATVSQDMDRILKNPSLEDEPGQDDLLYITTAPWISFSSVMHPIHMHPVDSFPRIAWGKYFEENGIIKLPLSVQAHHALIDGLHLARYFQRFQELADRTGWLTSGAE